MAKKQKGKRPWVFTSSRRSSLAKAQKRHKIYVELGKVEYNKRVKS